MRDEEGRSPEERREERWQTLRELEAWLETPMLVLSLVWLALLVLELTRGLSGLLQGLGTAIWVVFWLEFLLRLVLAPERGRFLARQWLTLVSLLLPALRLVRAVRIVRVLRAARAARSLTLVRVVGSVNRGMRALGRSLGRRGLGYVAVVTALVTLGGAAGMHAFERDVPDSPLTEYPAALWWTAMVITTMGSDYFPRSAEGRLLCVLLAVYAFSVFGYLTAALATFFLSQDAEQRERAPAGPAALDALHAELRALRAELRERLPPPGPGG